jgi:hypothetical protein
MSPRKAQPCTLPDCDDTQRAVGLCNRHYLRARRHGSPHAGGSPKFTDDADRLADLWLHVDKSGPNGCWIYTGKRYGGYGQHTYDGKPWLVHRLIYTLLIGPVADDQQLDHLCHTADMGCRSGRQCPHRACCNPAHLEPVTQAENKRRSRRSTCLRGHLFDHVVIHRGRAEQRCSTCINERRRERYAERNGIEPARPSGRAA